MKWKKVLVCVMGLFIFTAATGSAAAEVFRYEAVSGQVISFDKYLVMDEAANVPNLTFQFTIKPGEGTEAEDSRLSVQGGDADSVSGEPTIARDQAVFHAGDTTYTAPQDLDANGMQAATQPKDPVRLEEGQKYAKKAVEVDFSGVTFSEPGVYRWVITEEAVTALGISNDAETQRHLDVYVIDQEGSLTVQGYVLHKDDSFTPITEGSAEEPAQGKNFGFINEYTTHDLTISKTVTGNQGSRDQYFRFTVKIESGTPGTVFDVDLSQADAVTGVNPYSPEAHENPASLTAGEDGSVEAVFWMQHGQSITILGLPEGASYTINEEAEDYRTDIVLTEGQEETASEDTTCQDDAIEADTTAAFTNDRTGIIPTGLTTHLLPYLVVMGAGLMGLLLICRRKGHVDR